MKKFILLIILICTFIIPGCKTKKNEDETSYPDLTIINISVNQNCKILVVVKNVGSGELPDDVYSDDFNPESAGVFIYINGFGWGGQGIRIFDPGRNLQQPGGEATYTSRYVVGTIPILVKAVVDLHNEVNESNERNNEMEASLTCQ